MTAIIPIDELDVVAVLGDVQLAGELRELSPVFRRRHGRDVIVWPERIEDKRVIATEVGPDVLAEAVGARAASMVADPIAARGANWALVAAGEGRVRYLNRNDLWASERSRLRDWLSQALGRWHEGDREAAIDLFDRAFMGSRRGLVAAVVRAGAARCSGDAAWAEMCFDDLERTIEYQGAAMLACRTNALWGELPHQSLLTELFDEARRGFDERMVAERVFEIPVPARAKQLAVAFALYRRLRPDVSARLPTALVSEAVAGEPSAADAIAGKLAADADWLRCVSQAQHDVVSEKDAVARAQLTDLTRFARTLYSLEVSADQRDRRIRWTSFCRVTAGADSFLDTVPWRAGERLADEVRRRLGYNGGSIDGFRRFAEEQAGVFIGSMDQFDGYDCAAAVPRNTPPCVFVQRRNAATSDEMLRVRFAVAHELGHLLSDRHVTSRWVCSTLGHDRADTEKRANAFAAYFLAPRHAVRALVPSLPEIDSADFYVAVQRVREEFGLSSIAAGEHLRNCHNDHALGRLPDGVRIRLSSRLANQPTRIHEDGDVQSENESALPLREGRYRTLVETLRRAGVLDDNRAASLIEPATL